MGILKRLGTLAVAAVVVPTGLAFAQTPNARPHASAPANPPSTATPANASTKQAFSRIQDLAQNVRRDVRPLKVHTMGASIVWNMHSNRLKSVKKNVNQMQKDVRNLEARNGNLAPWQQQLLSRVKQDSHELAYQTSTAIKRLDANHNTHALVATSYPQNIHAISKEANDTASSIGHAFQQHGIDMD